METKSVSRLMNGEEKGIIIKDLKYITKYLILNFLYFIQEGWLMKMFLGRAA